MSPSFDQLNLSTKLYNAMHTHISILSILVHNTICMYTVAMYVYTIYVHTVYHCCINNLHMYIHKNIDYIIYIPKVIVVTLYH